ncbi:MAG: hypothetical protein ACYC4E_02575, partial [Carboxydocellales bacterium]
VLIRLSPYFTAQMDRGVFIFIELEFGSLMFFVTDTNTQLQYLTWLQQAEYVASKTKFLCV